MLALLSNTDKKVYVYLDAQLEEKRKTISELMVLPYYHFDNLFIHERI